jgi:hypothetical protein
MAILSAQEFANLLPDASLLASEVLELHLGVLDGQLRCWQADGTARQDADAAQQEVERLKAQLRALAVDPDREL